MIDRQSLLADLQELLPALESDLRERVREVPDLDTRLRGEYQEAREAGRTAQAYEEWREEPITQAAVAWILGCVFVRFMEDNGLVERPRLSGVGERLKLARDHHTVFFQKHPSETDREYLLDVFRDVATLPAARELFDERHNPLWSLGLSGDGARKLLEFWQRIHPETGALVHDFTDSDWNTRFLGDLYQDLSEAARKKYALLQTPEFVEEFILDRTLNPAIEEFGYRELRVIDPTCGSGHFLLGAFRRLFELWLRHEPATNTRELAQRALDGVYGVDLNPFAVAIARFRLLTAALKACGVTRLKDAPGFRINLAVGDSLLHGPRFAAIAGVQATLDPAEDPLRHVYATEDREALKRILTQRYHVVVGNPPYITVKDKALNEAYRQKYGSCHRQYSLAVPFMERFFELALPGNGSAGFVGMITANSFMKREFGKKLIENFIPRWDLTHVLDTSGAYIPGHGTPTVILFGRNRHPVTTTIRTVMGIRGEPVTPNDPARGLVWSAIVGQIDQPGSSSDWVSVGDTLRSSFHKHPWSIGGGGAAELKELLEDRCERALADIGVDIGFMAITGEDNCLLLPPDVPSRLRLRRVLPLVDGEALRDWYVNPSQVALWPNAATGERLAEPELSDHIRFLWPYRTNLRDRKAFGAPIESRGIPWWAIREVYCSRFRTPLSIAFAFVATHNHFVLDRGGKVFNRSAPVIKLPELATEDDHLALLGLLNSSTACFWMKQVFQPKSHSSQRHHPDPARRAYEFTGTGLEDLPIPSRLSSLATLASTLGELAEKRRQVLCFEATREAHNNRTLRRHLEARWPIADSLREQMIPLQEEIDWNTYQLFSLTTRADVISSATQGSVVCPRGQRPFEQLLGRRSLVRRAGSEMPLSDTEAPPVGMLSPQLDQVWAARRAEILANPSVRAIEQPEFKRLWRDSEDNVPEPHFRRDLDARHMRELLWGRLEGAEWWPEPALTTCARLGDRAQGDPEFMEIAELYRGRTDFHLAALIAELIEAATIPFLPVLRYTDTGLRKRLLWERTWELQRREDRPEPVGEIPGPPKYTSADFKNGNFWRLRGKLDVPKERFISYPGCERSADPTPVIGWAGWNHLQQAQALAGYFVSMKENEDWSAERLTPLLDGLLELLPWLEQWHNDLDPAYGMGMGEYFRRFLDEEIRSLDLTMDAVRGWKPSGAAARKRKKR